MLEQPVTKEFCDERHKNTEQMLNKIDRNITTLFGRMNWFFILAIGTLTSALTAVVLSCLPK